MMMKLSWLWWDLEGFRMGDRIKQVVVRFGGGLGWVTELSRLWWGLDDDEIEQVVVRFGGGLGWVTELSRLWWGLEGVQDGCDGIKQVVVRSGGGLSQVTFKSGHLNMKSPSTSAHPPVLPPPPHPVLVVLVVSLVIHYNKPHYWSFQLLSAYHKFSYFVNYYFVANASVIFL